MSTYGVYHFILPLYELYADIVNISAPFYTCATDSGSEE